MICQDARARQCQDILMHLLYSGHCEALLRSLISQSVQNVAQEYAGAEGVRRALVPFEFQEGCPRVTLAMLRAVFFVLLNQDSRMRELLCVKRVLPHIPELCPHKACRLYDSLRETVVPEWVKNEGMDLLQFVEALKDAYLVS